MSSLEITLLDSLWQENPQAPLCEYGTGIVQFIVKPVMFARPSLREFRKQNRN